VKRCLEEPHNLRIESPMKRCAVEARRIGADSLSSISEARRARMMVLRRPPELHWNEHVLETIGAESKAKRWSRDDHRINARIRDPGPTGNIGAEMRINTSPLQSSAEIMIWVRLAIRDRAVEVWNSTRGDEDRKAAVGEAECSVAPTCRDTVVIMAGYRASMSADRPISCSHVQP
jgi:hypothetical protein